MTMNQYGEGIDIPAPDWVTPQVEYLLRNAKHDLPSDFPLVTIDKDFGLAIHVDARHFNKYTVEQRIAIALRLNQLREEIEETGCPTWIDKN